MSVAAPHWHVKAAPGGALLSSQRLMRHVACRPRLRQSWPGAIRAGILMLLVPGGAGFIGSNVVAALNDAGRADVAVCDVLGHDGKWRNLAKRQLAAVVAPPGA